MKQVEKLANEYVQIKNDNDLIFLHCETYEAGFRKALELAAKKVNMNPDFTIYTTDEIYSQLLQIADREVE